MGSIPGPRNVHMLWAWPTTKKNGVTKLSSNSTSVIHPSMKKKKKSLLYLFLLFNHTTTTLIAFFFFAFSEKYFNKTRFNCFDGLSIILYYCRRIHKISCPRHCYLSQKVWAFFSPQRTSWGPTIQLDSDTNIADPTG